MGLVVGCAVAGLVVLSLVVGALLRGSTACRARAGTQWSRGWRQWWSSWRLSAGKEWI